MPHPAYAEGQSGTGKLLQARCMQRFSLAPMAPAPRDMLPCTAPCKPHASSFFRPALLMSCSPARILRIAHRMTRKGAGTSPASFFGHHRDKLGAGYTSANACVDLVSRGVTPLPSFFGHHRDKLGAGYTSANACVDLVSRGVTPLPSCCLIQNKTALQTSFPARCTRSAPAWPWG